MIFTNFREIDKLGRIVISKDIRKYLDIHPGDMLMINAEGETITIKKAENQCVFCHTTENLTLFEEKHICMDCLSKLRSL